MITTDTHRIDAFYTINDGIKTYDIGINGNTLDEIVDDMLVFANYYMEEKATDFEVTENDITEDNFKVTITGEVYQTDQDGDFTQDTDTMTITIEGWEK